MSKPPSTKRTKTFSYTPSYPLPNIAKLKTEWDLKTLFYQSLRDPRLHAAIDNAEKRYTRFAKKHRDLGFLRTDQALLRSLEEYKALLDTELDNVFVYLFLRREKDATDTEAEKYINQLQQRVTNFSNQITYYTLALGKLETARQKKLLANSTFAEYHHLLRGIFKTARYTLSEAEEKVLSLKTLTSRSLWIAGTEKIIGAATITVNGKKESLNGAMMEMLDAPRTRRHALWKAIRLKLEEIGPIAENELTALVLDKKINDELRGYKHPVQATVDSFDSTKKTLDTLTEVVTTKGYALAHRFYKLKERLYGKPVPFIDRDDFPRRLPKVTYETAVTICRDAFYDFNEMYGQIFDEMLTGGHIDVYPKIGKGGGAFCISSTNTPTLMMLNHADDFGSLRTLAHEMGHAIHAYRSKAKQSVLYQDHSVLTAETASTFFEAVVGHRLMQQLSDSEKTIYLNALISDKLATMAMCIARYQAELEIHTTIRNEGALSWQSMAAILAKHLRAYCGPSVNVEDADGLSIVAKTHYRRDFYQYSYSLGVIASGLMFERCLADPQYKTSVDRFLSLGESDSVENIFKTIGINVQKADTHLAGLATLEKEIIQLETLTKKR